MRLLNLMIWFMGIDLVVRMGWIYKDPVPVGIVWIVLVSLKSAVEAITGWKK